MSYAGPPLRWAALASLVGGSALAAPAAAQIDPGCPTGRIVDVVIENNSVFEISEADGGGRFDWAYRLANRLHIQTDAEVVERELLFEVGDCYDVELLRDSERLLRAFDFLANADVYGIRLPDGSVVVVVGTQDEWSTRIEPRIESEGSVGLRGLRIVEDNLLGTGRHIALFYDRPDDEQIYGVSYGTPQLLRTRWNMGLSFAKTDVGYSYREAVTHPFVGEVGRWAFRQAIDRSDRFFEVLMPLQDEDLARIWVPVRRRQFEVGGAYRRGTERYRHTLFGAVLAGESVTYPGPARFADPESRPPLASGTLNTDWESISSVRVMLMTAQRNISFRRGHALDTVNGTEDVQLGVEAEASIGPTLPTISEDRDIAVGLGLFAASGIGRGSFAGGQFAFEAHRSYETLEGFPEWTDVFADFSLWAYLRRAPESRHTLVATVTGVGGWHSRAPFQLTLGGDSGLRGYPRHVDPGGRRIVASFEHRAYVAGPFADLFDLGTVAFLDVGKIWPGHAAFGTESPIRGSVGLGLRIAFPPGSRQTFRVDVGFPADRGTGFGDLAVSIGVGQVIGRGGARRDPQIARSSRYGVGTSDFISAPRP
ncbi:MAG: hypothetical protein WD737_09435 [Gemmatimonadota bacterium]